MATEREPAAVIQLPGNLGYLLAYSWLTEGMQENVCRFAPLDLCRIRHDADPSPREDCLHAWSRRRTAPVHDRPTFPAEMIFRTIGRKLVVTIKCELTKLSLTVELAAPTGDKIRLETLVSQIFCLRKTQFA